MKSVNSQKGGSCDLGACPLQMGGSMKKTGQTTKADLPTIGVSTVEKCHQSNIIGIAIQANTTLVLDKENIIKKADELGLFITVIK